MDVNTRNRSAPGAGYQVRQRRSRKTYDALIMTGFRLLEDRDLEDISIAELTREAGYSVGAFYARFRSKDEFFDALVERHLQLRMDGVQHLLATVSTRHLVRELIENIVKYYWEHRNFRRAQIARSLRNPEFWTPIRKHHYAMATLHLDNLAERRGRKLSDAEEMNVRFAFQLVFAAINNNVIHRPGPVLLGEIEFVDNLVRAFRLVSDFDRLMGLQE